MGATDVAHSPLAPPGTMTDGRGPAQSCKGPVREWLFVGMEEEEEGRKRHSVWAARAHVRHNPWLAVTNSATRLTTTSPESETRHTHPPV